MTVVLYVYSARIELLSMLNKGMIEIGKIL
jgi:hypothetical protein